MAQRTDSLKRNNNVVINPSPILACTNQTATMGNAAAADPLSSYHYNTSSGVGTNLPNSPKMTVNAAAYRHVASNVPTPKGSPMRRPNATNNQTPQGSPSKRQVTGEEQWVDGPRLSKSKVAEARHLLREINHVKQREQWIDGPKMSPSKTLATGGALPASSSSTPGYGYMDSHKKTMIRQWVENQSSQIFPPGTTNSGATATTGAATATPTQSPRRHLQPHRSTEDDQHSIGSHHTHQSGAGGAGSEMVNPTSMSFTQPIAHSSASSVRVGLRQQTAMATDTLDLKSEKSMASKHNDSQESEDQDSGPSEVPPALPLIEPLSSREVSHDSLHIMCSRHISRESLHSHLIQTKDCGLQVTEDDICKAMG